ncbi:MAG: 23S rRNA (uracil(1939)-C(5))-methyltransferase RlmD [Nitrospirota bacterium]
MNDITNVVIEKLVSGGKGLGRLATGQAVFVNGVLPGEQVEILIKRKRKGFLEADPVRIVQPSEDRIPLPCEGEKQCTGATWPHIAYPAQLRFKAEILLDTLKRIGGLEPRNILPIIPSPRVDHYRLRTQFNVRMQNGKQRIGFFRQGSYDLIEVEDAFLLHPVINKTVSAIRSLTAELPLLCEIHINTSPAGEVHILFFCEQEPIASLDSFFCRLVNAVPEVIGLSGFVRKKYAFSFGKNQLTLSLGNLTLHATEGNFYQVNWDQNKNMVSTVMDFTSPAGTETILDLYCGIGNFSLPLAQRAATVIGIESGFSAIQDAQANAELNNIRNVEFIADDMQKGLKVLLSRKIRPDLIVLDPPRAGATLKTLERILALVPKKIIYVSCNPSTLARDLKYFHLFGFRLNRLQPIDMFPYTYHIECVAEMLREE